MAPNREKAGDALTTSTTEIMHMCRVTLNAFLTTYILQAPLACKVRSLLTHVH
jgi:hypothetical protein